MDADEVEGRNNAAIRDSKKVASAAAGKLCWQQKKRRRIGPPNDPK
jgi:hypothetical protein